MIGHTAAKRAQWQVEHELRKYALALAHDGIGRNPQKPTVWFSLLEPLCQERLDI